MSRTPARPTETPLVANVPDKLVLKRHRDLVGREWHISLRRGLFALVCVVPVLALVNLFGQHPQTTRAGDARATLRLYAPPRIRSGLLYEARFTVSAHRELKDATLLLAPGWAEGQTINTIEPSPVSEGSRNGKLLLELGHIPRGEVYRLFLQFQVNPTNVGRHDQSVELFDRGKRVAAIGRTITVFP